MKNEQQGGTQTQDAPQTDDGQRQQGGQPGARTDEQPGNAGR